MSTSPAHVHIFDKGCHQPWYAEYILANYLVVHNDGGDKMRIVRAGKEHPSCHSVLVVYADGGEANYPALEQALIDLTGSDTYHYLEDALAIRKQEYGA